MSLCAKSPMARLPELSAATYATSSATRWRVVGAGSGCRVAVEGRGGGGVARWSGKGGAEAKRQVESHGRAASRGTQEQPVQPQQG